jgi:uncharacterized coiled-coil DUF342 family protein
MVGLVALFVSLANAESEESKAAKEAAERADRFADAAEEAKNKANELKEAFKGYQEVVDKLNSCTKGTNEWKAALEDVNNSVLEIIQKYPELLTMPNAITRDAATGALKISEEAMKTL